MTVKTFWDENGGFLKLFTWCVEMGGFLKLFTSFLQNYDSQFKTPGIPDAGDVCWSRVCKYNQRTNFNITGTQYLVEYIFFYI